MEVDETYVGGKVRSRDWMARKTKIVGAKDRETKKVRVEVLRRINKETIRDFLDEHIERGARVHTDGAGWYVGMPFPHESVDHYAKEWVRGDVHTNGIESFWSMLKRGHKGVYHHFSMKHAPRYVHEFAGRQNVRGLDTADQMVEVVRRMEGKRLPFRELTE